MYFFDLFCMNVQTERARYKPKERIASLGFSFLVVFLGQEWI